MKFIKVRVLKNDKLEDGWLFINENKIVSFSKAESTEFSNAYRLVLESENLLCISIDLERIERDS